MLHLLLRGKDAPTAKPHMSICGWWSLLPMLIPPNCIGLWDESIAFWESSPFVGKKRLTMAYHGHGSTEVSPFESGWTMTIAMNHDDCDEPWRTRVTARNSNSADDLSIWFKFHGNFKRRFFSQINLWVKSIDQYSNLWWWNHVQGAMVSGYTRCLPPKPHHRILANGEPSPNLLISGWWSTLR